MRKPPSVAEFLRYPATAGTALLALGLTLAWWGKVDMSGVVDSALITRGEVWRLLTSTLLHASVLHLAFNLYWLWVFGSLVEERFGTFALVGIMVFLGVGSSAAEFAILYGGVGLSGIGYGLFGMLWVLSRRDERFADAVDQKTVQLFVLWFFLCIVLTVTGAMAIANIAHGVGALLGALLAWAISERGRKRTLAWTSASCALVVLFGLAMFARPYINLDSGRGEEEEYLGYESLQKDQNQEALRWYLDATRLAPQNASNWFNLGIAYHKLDNLPLAKDAYGRAAQLEPSNAKYSEVVTQFESVPAPSKRETEPKQPS